MGANMAHRLKDREFHITAVYDTNRAAATSLAAELGCAAAQHLSEVTAESDVIFTVVTDDNAMRQIFGGTGDNLLVNARGKLFVNCATISPQVHVDIEQLAEKADAQTLEACMASSIPQAREGKLYLMCGGKEEAFRTAEPILKELAAQIRFIGRCGTGAGFGNAKAGFFADRRGLARARNRWRRHAKSRAQLLFLCCARGQRQRDCSRSRAQSRS